MVWVGMEDTYPQHPTGFTCIMCGGIAVVENKGTYLCAVHAIEAMSDESAVERDLPGVSRMLSHANPVDLSHGGEVRSAGSTFCREHPVPLRCRPLLHHRLACSHAARRH